MIEICRKMEKWSKCIKIWLCNEQVGQHVVDWWENKLQDAVHAAAAGSWFSHHSTMCWPTDFDAFRPFCYNGKDQTDSSKNTGGGASQNSKFILYHIIYL